jgi:MraZ protein
VALFIDTFVNRIDRKGRVSVPATFRAALAGQTVQGIIAFPSFK